MEPESTKTFTRMFRGYDPAAVDAHVEMLTTKQQLLLDDVESLRARLKDFDDEVGCAAEGSCRPHRHLALAARGATADGEDAAAGGRRGFRDAGRGAGRGGDAGRGGCRRGRGRAAQTSGALADLVAQREALDTDYAETKKKLDAELAGLRADAQQEREKLLADAKQEADKYREQARRELDEVSQQRITILEQLAGVYRDLEGVPATLESAYQELKNPSES